MDGLSYVKVPTKILRLNLKGLFEGCVFALIYSFGSKGLRISNRNLAAALNTSSRTVERIISRLKKEGYIENVGPNKYTRRLMIKPDLMVELNDESESRHNGVLLPASEVADDGMTADHKLSKVNKDIVDDLAFSFSDFVSFWNIQERLPVIRVLTRQRRAMFNLLMQERSFAENCREIISRISKSDFCTGKNSRSWRADIDWLLSNPGNYVKVLEGKYDNPGSVEEVDGIPPLNLESRRQLERMRAQS